MPSKPSRLTALVAFWGIISLHSPAGATEYGFSTYSLGGTAFGAGFTPPPGTYVTAVTGVYSGEIGGNVNFGGVIINAGAKVEGVTSATNILYVPEKKIFGGHLGLSLTIPIGHVNLDATIGVGPFSTSREVDGWGMGDLIPKIQLGWQQGAFSHTVYLQAVAPTGRYDVGFVPIIGLHRPGIDMGWTFTWVEKATKLQFNGSAGFTFNFENSETNYRSGNEFHFEWAVGREIAPGLTVGVVGYNSRQITDDSGSGALLGDFRGRVDAIGPGLTYTTTLGKQPLILNLRHYQEYNVENRFEGHSTILSGTMRF